MTWASPLLSQVSQSREVFFSYSPVSLDPKKATGLVIISVIVFKNINDSRLKKKKKTIEPLLERESVCMVSSLCPVFMNTGERSSISLSVHQIFTVKQHSRKRLLITSVRTTYCASNRTNFDRFHPLLICCHYIQNQ